MVKSLSNVRFYKNMAFITALDEKRNKKKIKQNAANYKDQMVHFNRCTAYRK